MRNIKKPPLLPVAKQPSTNERWFKSVAPSQKVRESKWRRILAILFEDESDFDDWRRQR
jgi:uncharacterized protein YeaO (DUF488 family)